MRRPRPRVIGSALIVALAGVASTRTPSGDKPPSSYLLVVSTEDVARVMARMRDAKPEVIGRQRNLLDQRYDLSDRPGEDDVAWQAGARRPACPPVERLDVGRAERLALGAGRESSSR